MVISARCNIGRKGENIEREEHENENNSDTEVLQLMGRGRKRQRHLQSDVDGGKGDRDNLSPKRKKQVRNKDRELFQEVREL